MKLISKIHDFKWRSDPGFLQKAADLEPELNKRTVSPEDIVTVSVNNDGKAVVSQCASANSLSYQTFSRGGSIILDFGEHVVGYVSFTVNAVGSHYDAPAFLRLRFAELPLELTEHPGDYNGWLSKSWIQEEYLHLDDLPAKVSLPRRYAFRYMQLDVVDTSQKYSVMFSDIQCEAVTAMDVNVVAPLTSSDELLTKIDRAGLRTLVNCSQKVFEDGVKRDRRLWLGDLYLQAQTNHLTFHNHNLVKRCLYLFAGMTFEDGRMGACVFDAPLPAVDDTYLLDYALLFVPTLLEYYEASHDRETLDELYPQAMEQIDICLNTMMDEHGVIADSEEYPWCFLDWGEGLNRQCGAQAVLIYCMRSGVQLAELMGDTARAAFLQKQISLCSDAAIRYLWDKAEGLFVSGKGRQISWASQVWMILAQVFDQEKNRKLMDRLHAVDPENRMVTPYMYHFYIEALILCGRYEEALDTMKRYWGGMIAAGADTFWEIYDPKNENESPYGSTRLNSYCHAWSCTPSYLLRKHYLGNAEFCHLFS